MKRFSNISIILKVYLTVISIFFCFRFILFLAELDKIPSQSNYPLAEVKTTLGVPDDYMFRYSIPVIDKLASEGKPFFVTFMTASDHGPWCVPEYYHSKQKNLKDKVIEYADWSLKEFVRMASARPPPGFLCPENPQRA